MTKTTFHKSTSSVVAALINNSNIEEVFNKYKISDYIFQEMIKQKIDKNDGQFWQLLLGFVNIRLFIGGTKNMDFFNFHINNFIGSIC